MCGLRSARRARRLPALSAGVDSDGFDERMPLFLDPSIRPLTTKLVGRTAAEGRDEAGFNVLRVRRRFYVRRLVRTGAAMAVAAAIAGALVLSRTFSTNWTVHERNEE